MGTQMIYDYDELAALTRLNSTFLTLPNIGCIH